MIFGILALSRIKRSAQGGRGLAIAALIISGIWAVIFALLVVAGLAAQPSRTPTGTLTTPASVSVNDLKVGDCLATIPNESNSVSKVDGTPCTNPHRAEVYAVFDLTDGEYQGTQRVRQLADDGCSTRAPKIGTRATGKLEMYYVYPQQGSWKLGDHSVTCFVASSKPVMKKLVP